MWQNVVRQEVAFCECVKDVVTKNAKKSAFDGIYRAFREMKKWDAAEIEKIRSHDWSDSKSLRSNS